eukprot:gnl/Hemi2/5659_TR1948_c0_g1_i1.p1 gnl/Hemi2/5659_TR1948_c0_g1~~gnl/Hemi2/5659_TR1948_c0_g1_i1.p1  ORF type:complete len:470 (+),score=116.62 gnl/Hemi2/5659_TR1948_c0_g1_i1:105-1412(+)
MLDLLYGLFQWVGIFLLYCIVFYIFAGTVSILTASKPWKAAAYRPVAPPVLEKTQKPEDGKKSYLVLGGGLLGSHIVRALLDRGETHIRVFDMFKPRPGSFGEFMLSDPRVTFLTGDITGPGCKDRLNAAMKDVDVVFHTIAFIDYPSNYGREYDMSFTVNVEGTYNVLDGCIRNGVGVLVATSSIHVAMSNDWNQVIDNATEETNPPVEDENLILCNYSRTKLYAEKAVLGANGLPVASVAGSKKFLRTCALRPPGIIGEGCALLGHDWHNAPEGKVVQAAWPDESLGQAVEYAGNVALAHLCSADTLLRTTEGSGEAYFVGGYQNMSAHRLALNIPGFTKEKNIMVTPMFIQWAICYFSAFTRAAGFKRWFNLNWLILMLTPPVMHPSHRHYTYNNAKLRKAMGYAPKYTVAEAVQRQYQYQRRINNKGKKQN